MKSNHYFRSFTAVLLAALMLASSMVSCSESTENVDAPSDTVSESAQTLTEDTALAEQVEDEDAFPDFPHEERDFDGKIFNVLSDEDIGGNNIYYNDLVLEEATGDVLENAIYDRNLTVTDRFNVGYATTSASGANSQVAALVNSGDTTYDAFVLQLSYAYNIGKYFYDLNSLDNLSIDATWWDQNAIDNLSIANKLKFITGDIFIKHYDGIQITLFNKEMLTNYNLEDPYTLVNEGRWTIDKMGEMCHAVTCDLDNNGVMDRYDQWGYATQLVDYYYGLINGSGEMIFKKDENDIPYSDSNVEKISSIFEKFYSFWVDATFDIERDAGYANLCAFWVFPEGRSLFYWAMPRYINWQLRDTSFEFGILPNPKYDEEQESYYSSVDSYHSLCYAISLSAANPEDSAYIMDALAYYGEQMIKPAYYDVCLQRKLARDQESSEMLDIIFDSTVYDIGAYADFGGLYTNIRASLVANKEVNFASMYAKAQKPITKAIENYVKGLE